LRSGSNATIVFPTLEAKPPGLLGRNLAAAAGIVQRWANHDGMTEHEASRTLVKSPPELWAECSDAGSLSRHLDPFGEIRITKLEPETAVAWEGEHASGTVRIEPSGWGTRVILTARSAAIEEVMKTAPEVMKTPPEVMKTAPEVMKTAPEVIETAPVEAELVQEQAREAQAELPEPEDPPQPVVVAPAAPARRSGIFARLRARFRRVSTVSEATPTVAGAPTPEVVAAPEPEVVAATKPEVVAATKPEVVAMAPAEPEPPAQGIGIAADPAAVLAAALDSLGQAHHRPYSRS